MGWFGPRGLASVVFTLIALEEFAHSGAGQTLGMAATWTILLSVVLHGISASPLAARYGARTAKSPSTPSTPRPASPASASATWPAALPSLVSRTGTSPATCDPPPDDRGLWCRWCVSGEGRWRPGGPGDPSHSSAGLGSGPRMSQA